MATNKTEKESAIDARSVPGVPPPNTKRLSMDEIYNDDCPNPEIIKEHFIQEGRLSESAALRLIHEATQLLQEEPTVLQIPAPVTVCGDTHGQFYDLLTIFRPNVGGDVHDTNYLFLGDYVDRGCFGMESILYLYSLKIRNPQTFFMLRGNHESRHLTEYFTFKEECLTKYSQQVYDACMASFDALPLAAVINKQFLCIHGGLSPKLSRLSDFDQINRFQETPSKGIFCDILWSDPTENFGDEPADCFSFDFNSTRGCAYFYSYKAVSSFLQRNHLLGIIRGHEIQGNGFKTYKSVEPTRFPILMTVFSAPHYLDMYDNKAAVLHYENNVISFRQYGHVPHPFWLPNFTNAFSWSLPFVAEKVTEIFLAILNMCSEEEIHEPTGTGSKKETLKQKISAVNRLHLLYEWHREQSDDALSALDHEDADGEPAELYLDEKVDCFEGVSVLPTADHDEPTP